MRSVLLLRMGESSLDGDRGVGEWESEGVESEGVESEGVEREGASGEVVGQQGRQRDTERARARDIQR